MDIKKLNNAIAALKEGLETPQLTEVKLHSQHELKALEEQLEPVLKYSYDRMVGLPFNRFAGVPVKLDLDVPPFFIRYCKSDDTFEDFKLFN